MYETLGLYKYFDAVAGEKSITAAAKKLYISQPAVSAAIARLEEILGVRLFVRGNRGIELTDEGKMLYEHLSRGLTFINSGEEKLRENAGLRGGVLRIGASDMTLRYFLLDAIERFDPYRHGIKLQITNNPTPKTLDELRRGSIDLCAVSSPIDPDEDFEIVPLRVIRDIFVCSPDYPVSGRISASELKKHKLIMLEHGTSSRAYVEKALFGEDSVSITPDVELATSELLLDFAARGLGIASVVEDFALPMLERGRLRRVLLEEPIPERRMLLVYYKNIPQAPATREFLELCRNMAACYGES